MEVERVSIWFFNEDHSEIICKDLYRMSKDLHEVGLNLHAKDYPRYFKALNERRILAANDACNDLLTSEFTEGYLKPHGITSMLDVPVRLHGKIVGIVCHEHTGPIREWTVEEQDFTASIADMVSLALESSERKQAEEQLRKLSQAIEQSPVTVIITDKFGNIEYANPKFSQLTGYTSEEAFGQNTRVLKSGKTPPEVYKELWKTIKSGNEWRGEFCNRKKNGELYWEYAVISPVKNPEGVITHFIAVKEDITGHKKMEKALFQSEKLKSIGTITAGVAHEFNNILTIISGNVQLLEGRYKDHEELTEALRTIKRATNDGAEISRRMLKFTKTAKDTAGFVPFDINELINQAIDFTAPRWKTMAQVKGINYCMDTEGMGKISSILCNPTELREVFINLINNALDAE